MSLKVENIYVNNYKSFHDAAFKFDDFNIIVGANNAGKSNFLDLLEFIDNTLRTDLITAVKEKGGFKRIKNFRSKEDFIEIKVDLKHSWSTNGWYTISSSIFYYVIRFNTRYSLSLKITRDDKYLTGLNIDSKIELSEIASNIYDELMNIEDIEKLNRKREEILKKECTEIILKVDSSREIKEIDNEQIREAFKQKQNNIDIVKKSENISYGASTLKDSLNIAVDNLEEIPPTFLIVALNFFFRTIKDSIGTKFAGKEISHKKFLEYLQEKTRTESIIHNIFESHIYTYNFDVAAIRRSMREPDSLTLNKNGSNLHYILKKLSSYNNDKDIFENISCALIGLVDEVEKIKIEEQNIGTDIIPEILFVERNGYPVAREDISDGTLSLLALSTALFSNDFYSHLLAFEEPERHIHLSAVFSLMNLFRDHVKFNEKQVIITTQSSEVLRNIDADSDNIIFVYRNEDGFSKAISSKELSELKTLVKDYEYNIDEIVRNEILGYLGDYAEEQEK